MHVMSEHRNHELLGIVLDDGLTCLLTPWNRVLLEKLTGSQSRYSLHVMEPDDSLTYVQVPATCPYPEPAQSSPCPHIPLPEDPS